MSFDSAPYSSTAHANDVPLPPAPAAAPPAAPGWTWLALLVGAAGLGCSAMLWQKVDGMQEQLARQTADATAQAIEARSLAKENQDVVRDLSSRLAVMEARVGEVNQQRLQLEDLVRSLSRSHDETLLLDIESAIRLALQQNQLTNNTEGLIGTLKTAQRRLERSSQPRLLPIQQAISADLEVLTQASVTDTVSLLARLDDLTRQIDLLQLVSDAPLAPNERQQPRQPSAPHALPAETDALRITQWAWWQTGAQKIWLSARSEARELLRVSRIGQPDAMLLTPEQAFLVRENLKHTMLNARLAILARQYDAARTDLQAAQATLGKYFSAEARRTHQVQNMLVQIQQNLRNTQNPSLERTLNALSTAAAASTPAYPSPIETPPSAPQPETDTATPVSDNTPAPEVPAL